MMKFSATLLCFQRRCRQHNRKSRYNGIRYGGHSC